MYYREMFYFSLLYLYYSIDFSLVKGFSEIIFEKKLPFL
jgi:hypothetical protein